MVKLYTAAGQYVLAFSHHTLRTIRQPTTDVTEFPIHYGQRVDRKDGQPQNPGGGQTLEELYCQYRNVLGHVNGHEHENYVLRHDCAQVPTDASQAPSPDVYEVSSSAHIDYPQQSRMIELVRNEDRTISLVLTMLDHDGPADPGGARPYEAGGSPSDRDCEEARGQVGDEVLKLSGIGRELAYNDYQGNRGARGGRQDRNVIIRFEDRVFPFPTDRDSSGGG